MQLNQPPAPLGPARDHEELRILMRANNVRHGKRFHYFDFHVFKGKLWCMYEIAESDRQEVARVDKQE